MTPERTRTVIERIRAGEVDAYAELVAAFQGDVRRVVAFALRDPDGTEDMVQQSFVTAYLRLDGFRAGRVFRPWVRGIARNVLREELRRRGRASARMRRYRVHLEAVGGDDTAAERHEEELRTALLRCREGLSENTRHVLDLRYGHSLGFAQIAESLGRTVAAARQLLQRARLALRTCIQEGMAGP